MIFEKFIDIVFIRNGFIGYMKLLFFRDGHRVHLGVTVLWHISGDRHELHARSAHGSLVVCISTFRPRRRISAGRKGVVNLNDFRHTCIRHCLISRRRFSRDLHILTLVIDIRTNGSPWHIVKSLIEWQELGSCNLLLSRVDGVPKIIHVSDLGSLRDRQEPAILLVDGSLPLLTRDKLIVLVKVTQEEVPGVNAPLPDVLKHILAVGFLPTRFREEVGIFAQYINASEHPIVVGKQSNVSVELHEHRPVLFGVVAVEVVIPLTRSNQGGACHIRDAKASEDIR